MDLKKKLICPEELAITTLGPNMILLPRSSKNILIAELTVPCEDRLAISRQLQKARYQDLIDEALVKGWHAVLFPIEVGCRGFPTTSVHCFQQKVSLDLKQLKKATEEIATAVETSSRWLWLSRDHSWNASAGEG